MQPELMAELAVGRLQLRSCAAEIKQGKQNIAPGDAAGIIKMGITKKSMGKCLHRRRSDMGPCSENSLIKKENNGVKNGSTQLHSFS